MNKSDNSNSQKILVKAKNAYNFSVRNNWIFTISFFFGVFAVSVLIWYQVVLYPEPSARTKNEIEGLRKNYPLMMREIDETAQMLSEKKQKFDSRLPVYDREIFYKEKEIPQEAPKDSEKAVAQPAP